MTTWTTPRTWVAGEVVTAAEFNSNVRDNGKVIGGSWTADARANSLIWTTTSSNVGNGTLVSRYRLVGTPGSGGTLDWDILLTAGSTTNFGSGQFTFAFPASCVPQTPGGFIPVMLNDASGATMLGAGTITGSTVNLRSITSAAGATSLVNATSPVTWTTNDVIGFYLRGLEVQ